MKSKRSVKKSKKIITDKKKVLDEFNSLVAAITPKPRVEEVADESLRRVVAPNVIRLIGGTINRADPTAETAKPHRITPDQLPEAAIEAENDQDRRLAAYDQLMAKIKTQEAGK